MNVVIVGGAGYIGFQLASLFISNKGGKHRFNLTIIDKQFDPHVAFICNCYNVNYIVEDIRNLDNIKPVLKQANLVYILAAVTGCKSNCKDDKELWDTNYYATCDLIDCCKDNAKIVFASSANVFGGLDKSKHHTALRESSQPKPLYQYALTKSLIESYFLGRTDNFCVLRFGANYGLAPNMRMGLVVNTFAKHTVLNKEIKLFGGGDNYRPFTHVEDSARALMYVGINDCKYAFYHCSYHGFKIKDIAKICKKINRKIKITKTDDTPPFASYSLDSTRLIEEGFKFKHTDLTQDIKDMIQSWGYNN